MTVYSSAVAIRSSPLCACSLEVAIQSLATVAHNIPQNYTGTFRIRFSVYL